MPKPTSNQILNRSGVVGNTVTDALETLRTTGSFGDMTKAVYDTNNNGKVDVAEVAENVHWVNIYDKPFTFPPSAHSHTDATTADSGFMSASDKTKLDGIAPGATANDTDVNLKDRANHTGTQAISTVTGLQTALDGKQDTLVSGTNIKTINGDSLLGSGNLVISGGGGGGESTATNIHAATSKTTPADADELGITDSAASWGLKKLTFANLKSWIGSLFVSKSGDTINGNLNFSGAARRITGRFSWSGSLSDQLLVQTNIPDSATGFYLIPSGASDTTAFGAINNVDPDNCSMLYLYANNAGTGVSSIKTGTGTYLPLVFEVGGVGRLRIDPTTGNVLVTSGALGYGVGSGGTVTQPTSKSTTVTLNKPSGTITMHNASLAAGASVEFSLNNNLLAAGDGLVVNPDGVTGYAVEVAYSNSATEVVLRVTNKGTTRSDAVVIRFRIFKGGLA